MATDQRAVVAEAVGLCKEFRDFWGRPKARAVNEVDFTVRQGEVVGLLGPNGSGKSTTVKLLLGLLYPTGGKVTVFGRSPRAVETKREIGYLPEETSLYQYLTAEETLDFFGSLFSLSPADRRSRISQLLEMVGLAHARNRRVGEFSKGMARRIGLAQAMINDPAFLILDEPTSGLDPLGCREVKDLILTLKKRGKTVLITSHLLSDMEDVCDRVIILYGGRVRASGNLNELLTVGSETRITTPALGPEAIKRLMTLLRGELKGETFSVDHPRRSLEEFFLDVIAAARRDSVETSGASGDGRIARYLSGEEETSPDAEKVLAALTREPESPAESAPASIAEDAADGEKERQQERALEALTSEVLPDAPDAGRVPEPAADAAKEAELADANAKLQDLLGGADRK